MKYKSKIILISGISLIIAILSVSSIFYSLYYDQINNLQMENNVLQNQFDELKVDYDYLEEQHNDLQSLTNNIDDLTYKLQQFELNKIKTDKQMSVVNTSITILEKDKNLLVILRYDAPRERAEAYDYWQNIKTKSVAVDPSLGPKVDKIISNLEPLFDWYDDQPPPSSEAEVVLQWIFSYPSEYDNSVTEYNKSLYFIIINHIRELQEM